MCNSEKKVSLLSLELDFITRNYQCVPSLQSLILFYEQEVIRKAWT